MLMESARQKWSDERVGGNFLFKGSLKGQNFQEKVSKGEGSLIWDSIVNKNILEEYCEKWCNSVFKPQYISF